MKELKLKARCDARGGGDGHGRHRWRKERHGERGEGRMFGHFSEEEEAENS